MVFMCLETSSSSRTLMIRPSVLDTYLHYGFHVFGDEFLLQDADDRPSVLDTYLHYGFHVFGDEFLFQDADDQTLCVRYIPPLWFSCVWRRVPPPGR